MRNSTLSAIAVLLLTATTAFAHHAFDLNFDKDKPVTLNGAVTRVVWSNPHVITYLKLKDDKGKVVNWKVEMGSPDALIKSGWTKTTLKAGQMVTLQGWRAKDGTNFANAEEMTMPDGRKLSAASSFDSANQRPVATSGEKKAVPKKY